MTGEESDNQLTRLAMANQSSVEIRVQHSLFEADDGDEIHVLEYKRSNPSE